MKVKNNKYFTVISRLRKWLPILLILSVAFTLYCYQINQESLWIDEIFSLRAAQKIGNLTLNRPLYFILLNAWMRFGNHEAWLRGLSVIFALGSVWLTYLLGCRLANKPIGLIAALLLTLSPLVINHSQEIRMYMLSMFLGLGGSLVLTFLLERPKISFCFWWLSLRILAVLTTPINFLLLVPDTLILGWQFHKQVKRILTKSRRWFWLLGILLIPSIMILKDIVPPLLDFLEGSKFAHKIGITAFVGGITRLTIWHLKSPLEQLTWFYEHIFFNLYALVLVILIGVAWLNWKNSNSIGLFQVTAWGFCPLIIIFFLSQVFSTLWGIDRYLLFTAPYIFIVLAMGLIQVWHWRKTVAFMIIAIYMIAIGGALFNYYTNFYREDWRGVAQMISIKEEPSDKIALFPDHYFAGLNYYYRGVAPIFMIERLPKEKLFKPIDRQSTEKMFVGLPEFSSRLWLVFALAHTSTSDPNQIIPQVLDKWFDLKEHLEFTGIDVYLVEKKEKLTHRLI